MLVENEKILLKNKKISDTFNFYFESVISSLDLLRWWSEADSINSEIIKNIISSTNDHPSMPKIKQEFQISINNYKLHKWGI